MHRLRLNSQKFCCCWVTCFGVFALQKRLKVHSQATDSLLDMPWCLWNIWKCNMNFFLICSFQKIFRFYTVDMHIFFRLSLLCILLYRPKSQKSMLQNLQKSCLLQYKEDRRALTSKCVILPQAFSLSRISTSDSKFSSGIEGVWCQRGGVA